MGNQNYWITGLGVTDLNILFDVLRSYVELNNAIYIEIAIGGVTALARL